MKANIILFVGIIIFIALNGSRIIKSDNMDFSTVQQFDLERYMGTWYEIARYDHRFERNLVGVTATYKLQSDEK